MSAPGRRSVAHAAEGGEADVLVQDVDLAEPRRAERIELVQGGPGRIFLFDVRQYVVAVGRVLQAGQVIAVALPEQPLDGGDRALDEVEHPERAAGPQGPVQGG